MGVFTAQFFPRVPFHTEYPFCIVSHWRGPHGRHFSYIVRIIAPDGSVMEKTEPYSIAFGGPGRTWSAIDVPAGVQFPTYGDYCFEIVFENQVQVSTVLSILPIIESTGQDRDK